MQQNNKRMTLCFFIGKSNISTAAFKTNKKQACISAQYVTAACCVSKHVQTLKDVLALINAPQGGLWFGLLVHSLPPLLAASSVLPLSTLARHSPTFRIQQRMQSSGWWEPKSQWFRLLRRVWGKSGWRNWMIKDLLAQIYFFPFTAFCTPCKAKGCFI